MSQDTTVSVLEPLTCFAWDRYQNKQFSALCALCSLDWSAAHVFLQSWEPAAREIGPVFQPQYVIHHIGKILVVLQMIWGAYIFSPIPLAELL